MSHQEHAAAPSESESQALPPSRSRRVPVVILAGVGLLLVAVVGLYLTAAARVNHEALAGSPKPVSTVKAERTSFRPARSYVGTIQPLNSARVGPQFVSAYVGAVLVRPGAVVKRGEVLATLDCRESSAASKEIAARARALAQRQEAAEHEAARVKEMKEQQFASANEAEQLAAKSASEMAEVEALKASLLTRGLQVDDCVLRAPFAGEVSDRTVDPGAYVRPGTPIVTVIDRNTVRVVADAPEPDFDVVAPGTEVAIEVLANGSHLKGHVSRRAPAADEQTRTVHFEIDIPNADRKLPVGTTASLSIDVGEPKPATAVPLRAATVRGEKATLFVVAGNVAKRVIQPVLGEARGVLYLDPALKSGTPVVIEGRALLGDGDAVAPRELAK